MRYVRVLMIDLMEKVGVQRLLFNCNYLITIENKLKMLATNIDFWSVGS